MIQSAAYEIIKEIERKEGRVEGRQEGRAEGRAEGETKGLTEAILDALVIRLNPTIASYRQLEKRVLALSDPERLRGLHRAAILANDVAEFEQALAG
jgi:predicted transposase YdaD